jgi:N-acyl-D-aspartate/D-glutamate deacylase
VVERRPEFPQASEALSALAGVYELAEKAVEDERDAHRAYELATAVTEAARQLTIQLGQLRALQAARIRDQESLSLTALANRIRVSKTRAVQILEIADKAREGIDNG